MSKRSTTLLGKIASWVSAPIIYREFSAAGPSISAGASSNVSIPITVPDGYEILCVPYSRTNGVIAPSYPDLVASSQATSVTVWLRNTTSATMKPTSVVAGVIFRKNL